MFKPGKTALAPLDAAHRRPLGAPVIEADDGRVLNPAEVHFDNGLSQPAP